MASVKVAVRVRPFNSRELDLNAKCIIKMQGNETTIFNGNDKSTTTIAAKKMSEEQCMKFYYDYSYWSFDPGDEKYASQEQVFADLGRDVVESAYEGYNVCVFAYGQTGSGKSYTMMGHAGDEGLIPRICRSMFRDIENEIYINYYEIYNEKFKDLLCIGRDLKLRAPTNETIYLENLSNHRVYSYQDIEALILKGNSNRAVAATLMNEASSRSHAILTVTLTQIKRKENLNSKVVSKINLVDLAGSENAHATTGGSSQRALETKNINQSLHTLMKIIREFNDINKSFYSYRESSLTQVLRNSLGGNSKTIMMACISPASVNASETKNTLRYANDAKKIVNKPMINEDPNTKLIRELHQEISQLKVIIGRNGLSNEYSENEPVAPEQISCQWSDFHELFNEDDHPLSLIRKERSALTIVTDKMPYLIGFNEDIMANSGLSFYALHFERNLLGSASNADILIDNADVQNEHCYIFYNQGLDVVLQPIGDSKCSVNGEMVTGQVKLQTGAVIVLGSTNLFRFINPYEIGLLKRLGSAQKRPSYFVLRDYGERHAGGQQMISHLKEISEHQAKIDEQKRQIELLAEENKIVRRELSRQSNETKLRLKEIEEKNELFEREKTAFLIEKEQFEEQRLLNECFKGLNEDQLQSLRELLVILKTVKNNENCLVKQIKTEKYSIQKEMEDFKAKQDAELGELRQERDKAWKDKDLVDTKQSISDHREVEIETMTRIEETRQSIENETQNLDQMKLVLLNRKEDLLRQNRTFEQGIEEDEASVIKQQRLIDELKVKINTDLKNVAHEIWEMENQLNKQLKEALLPLQNEFNDLNCREVDLTNILSSGEVCESEEKLLQDELDDIKMHQKAALQEQINTRTEEMKRNKEEQLAQEYEDMKQLEKNYELDLNELINDLQLAKSNSFKHIQDMIKAKEEEIDLQVKKLNECELKLQTNSESLDKLLPQYEKCEAKLLDTENKIFCSEKALKEAFKLKEKECRETELAVDSTHQPKLDDFFSAKEDVKKQIFAIIGEKKGSCLFNANLEEKLREIEKRYEQLRLNLSYDTTFEDTLNTSASKMSQQDAEKLYLNKLETPSSTSFTVSENVPWFKLGTQCPRRSSSLHSDLSNTLQQQTNSGGVLSSSTSASDLESSQTAVPLASRSSALLRQGIEIDIVNYALNTKSKLDVHFEYVIRIRIQNERWTIYRRYNRLRELHQKYVPLHHVLKRLSFPARHHLFNRNEKFLEERKLQLEHYLRCFIELLLSDPECPLNENSQVLTKLKLTKFCPFFQQTDGDLVRDSKGSILKFSSNIEQDNTNSSNNSNNLIY